MRQVAVIDIGKTNLKLALVDLAQGAEIEVLTAPNRALPGPLWPYFDVEAQWAFVRASLKRLARGHAIDGIVTTTHGACAALLTPDGELAAPVMDYEFDGLSATRAQYDALRPPFARTGSPGLPMGLNLGAQLHYMLASDASLRDRIAHVVTWPQYWGFRLTGQVACDLCSLGCHTDLWEPERSTWSELPERLGLAAKMAPPRSAEQVLGTLSAQLQAETGLGAVPVLVGIHDSNASLVPHLARRAAPFSVLSTGTWVIAMAIGGTGARLDPARDTLLNVNALGKPVPSARFMGGREHALLTGNPATGTEADARAVVARAVMCLPSVVEGCGPFPDAVHRWQGQPSGPGERAVAAGFYLALMSAECLSQIGAGGDLVIEGPFAGNPWFLRMLAAATGQMIVPSAGRTGTAVGAACLFGAPSRPEQAPQPIAPLEGAGGYIRAWRDQARGQGATSAIRPERGKDR